VPLAFSLGTRGVSCLNGICLTGVSAVSLGGGLVADEEKESRPCQIVSWLRNHASLKGVLTVMFEGACLAIALWALESSFELSGASVYLRAVVSNWGEIVRLERSSIVELLSLVGFSRG
jgi:hypothetical protein